MPLYRPIALSILLIITLSHYATPLNHFPCAYNSTSDVSHLSKCLQSIKQQSSDERRFWFGSSWRQSCSGKHNSRPKSLTHTVQCDNPVPLRRYKSLASRLLRVSTFDMAYLRNLKLLPRMTFHSLPGKYHGCDHEYTISKEQHLYAHPDMTPGTPWQFRQAPYVHWPNLDRSPETSSLYTLLIIDVASGQLNYLAFNFPLRTKVAQPYKGPVNVRRDVTALVLVVFEQSTGLLKHLHWNEANNLVGLNWALVTNDAYAMETQRVSSGIDNCPSLLKQRLYSPSNQLSLPFIPEPYFGTIDSWMSIEYPAEPSTFAVCCQMMHYRQSRHRVDAIGDSAVAASLVRSRPEISVAQPPSHLLDYNINRRQNRDYLVLLEQTEYTILVVDTGAVYGNSTHPLVHWLLINVPLAALAHRFTSGLAGSTLYDYIQPPKLAHHRRLVFMLFSQSEHIPHFKPQLYTDQIDNCPPELSGRCFFSIRELMARHSLSLRSISWVKIAPDEFSLYEYVKDNKDLERRQCHALGRPFTLNCEPAAAYTSLEGNMARRKQCDAAMVVVMVILGMSSRL